MATKLIEYTISLKEIERRKKAFTTLIASFFFGLIIFSFDFIILNILFSSFFLAFLLILLYISRILTIKSLNHYSQIQFPVNEQKIERKTKKSGEIYLFKDITKLNIKKR